VRRWQQIIIEKKKTTIYNMLASQEKKEQQFTYAMPLATSLPCPGKQKKKWFLWVVIAFGSIQK